MGFFNIAESADFFKIPAFFYINQKTKQKVKWMYEMKQLDKENLSTEEIFSSYNESVRTKGSCIGFLLTCTGFMLLLAYAAREIVYDVIYEHGNSYY